MDKQDLQKRAGIKSEIVVKPKKAIPSTITITFDTMWLLENLEESAQIFDRSLKPVEDIDFKALQKELQEDIEIQITQDYFRDSIDAGGFEEFLDYEED